MSNKHQDICEETVYKTVFQQYAKNIRNYLLAKCGDVSLSEDVVQEVFLKLWQKCADIRFATVKAFLYRVADNILTDQFRHKKVVLVHRQKLSINTVNDQTPQFQLEEKEFKEKLEHIINSMPEKSRVVFLMNRIEKLKYREIAERLGLSQKAVEKRMGIALDIFRKGIAEK